MFQSHHERFKVLHRLQIKHKVLGNDENTYHELCIYMFDNKDGSHDVCKMVKKNVPQKLIMLDIIYAWCLPTFANESNSEEEEMFLEIQWQVTEGVSVLTSRFIQLLTMHDTALTLLILMPPTFILSCVHIVQAPSFKILRLQYQ